MFRRDEERDKCSDHLKSSSSEESVRKRRPSGNLSITSQLTIFNQNAAANSTADGHHETTNPAANKTQSLKSTENICHLTNSSASVLHTKQSSSMSAAIPVPRSISAKLDHANTLSLQQQQQHQQQQQRVVPKTTNDVTDSLYESVEAVKQKYNYHDEPHSFESSMEFLEDFIPCEVLETTV